MGAWETLEVAEPRCGWVETFLGVGNREEEMAGNGSHQCLQY